MLVLNAAKSAEAATIALSSEILIRLDSDCDTLFLYTSEVTTPASTLPVKLPVKLPVLEPPPPEEAASGGLVYVGGANVTSATTYVQVDNVFTSTYSNYLITYRLIPVTNGNLFDFQFRDGSSNTLDANEYEYTINGFSSNNVATYRDHTGDGKIRLTHGVNNNTSRGGLTGYMTVHEPDSGDRCVVHIHHMYPTDDASLRNGIGSGTYKNTGTAIAGFQFFGNGSTANDNTAQARIKVYGMVDS